MSEVFNFYFSVKQKKRIESLNELPHFVYDYTLNDYVLRYRPHYPLYFKGKEFTEAIRVELNDKCNWDDAVLVGTGTYKDVT